MGRHQWAHMHHEGMATDQLTQYHRSTVEISLGQGRKMPQLSGSLSTWIPRSLNQWEGVIGSGAGNKSLGNTCRRAFSLLLQLK